jgi:predicted TPR repeat methyltransferase
MSNLTETLEQENLASPSLTSNEGLLEYFRNAIAKNPEVASFHSNISNVYLSLGDPEKAQQHLHQALRLDPYRPETYNNLGRLYYKQGLLNEAIPLFQKAIRMDPHYWEAHYNLAHSFSKQNQFQYAKTHYLEVLRLQPAHLNAQFNLGLIFIAINDFENAILPLKTAVTLDTSNAEAFRQLGNAYVSLGQINEAIAAFVEALALAPNFEDVQHNLAILYLRNQEREKALLHFKAALQLNPANETARHMTLALSTAEGITSSPIQYVTELFDQYAAYYNHHVKSQLNYQVPALLRNAVGRNLGHNPKAGRILDIGCGTGLCGIYFRDLANVLIGVDVSSKMIDIAKTLEGYDELHVMAVQKYLEKRTLDPFDLIVAGDVLIYTGCLDSLFRLIGQKLNPHGRFAFTVEALKANAQDYQLQATGRFAHSAFYIRKLAKKYHFHCLLEETIIPREQESVPIQGLLFILEYLGSEYPLT